MGRNDTCTMSAADSSKCLVPTCLYVHATPLQDGSQMRLSEADRKALVFGLMLHEKGTASLQAGQVQVRMSTHSDGHPRACMPPCVSSVSILFLFRR